MRFYNKYLKYKNKYIELKIQKGGLDCDNELVFKNTIGTCWMVAIQNILVFGDLTKNNLEETLKNISKKKIYDIKELQNDKKCFIEKQIQDVKNNPNLNNILPTYIFDVDKIEFLKKILNSFIDRYYSKIFNIKNNEQPDITSIEYKQGRCEILINQNFKRLFIKYSINVDTIAGDLIEQYLFINILSIFLLNYKVSFINYYKDNYKDINYNNSEFIGIIIHIEKHACCFFLCNNFPKYYNDTNKKTYDCDWKALLKETDKDLYIIKNNCVVALNKSEFENYSDYDKLKKIKYLTIVTKNKNCDFDQQINIMLNKKENDFNKISDSSFLQDIGLIYDQGSTEINKNICKAIEYYNKSIKDGYNEAKHNLGVIYDEDKKNIKLAIKLFTESALNGHKKSMEELVKIYEKNEKYKNTDNVTYWYTKLAKYGDDSAQYYLAEKYETGIDIPINLCEANYWYIKLLKKYKDNDKIQYKLGINYYNLGNYAEALKWLKSSGKKNIDAQLKLGQIYEDGIYNYKFSDYNKAINWYKRAADNGNIEALINIGLLYEKLNNTEGLSDIQNGKLAYEYYSKAASLNNKNAQYYLAKIYEDGKYVKKDIVEAIKWFKEAAKNGNIDAQYKLGIYYIDEDNDYDGIIWLTYAAYNGHLDAQYKLGIYSYNKKNYEEAFEWLSKAAEQNDLDAQVFIGNMYYEGIGTPEDITKAIFWYKRAAYQGNSDAKNILFSIDRTYKPNDKKSSKKKDKEDK